MILPLQPAGTRALAAVFLTLLVLWPADALPQQPPPPRPDARVLQPVEQWTAPMWVGDVTFMASNALLGGLTAGVTQRLRGGTFRDGFARGSGGGAVAYVGRRIAARRFGGAGLVGRQVSAVGGSVVRNAGEGLPALERLMFPLGPVHFFVDRADGFEVRPKINLPGLAQAGRLAFTEEATIDWSASVSAGAPVFRSPGRRIFYEGGYARGIAINRSVVLGESGQVDPERVFAHERVHVLQEDFAFLAWSDPLEAWLAGRSRFTRALYRHLDFGLVLPALGMAAARLVTIDYVDRPAEIEARFLEGR